MRKFITTAVAIVAAAASIFCGPGELPAQQASQRAGRDLSTSPFYEDEDLAFARDDLPSCEAAYFSCAAYSPDCKTLAVGDRPYRPCCAWEGPAQINPYGGIIRLFDTKMMEWPGSGIRRPASNNWRFTSIAVPGEQPLSSGSRRMAAC